MARVNCAVYVRKSTEKGLELEFNSLHNQEDACKSYILSQAYNNWEYYKTYEDGGISGGTMERPALKQMLEDISKGLIQTVVVYKVDRLSRSILDFHKMMKNFDKYNCNFVSITQSFDTSNSMGKLTLNMLLSFAQFEREVSSERVRDKIRASKAKGLWTGGVPKLGYDLKDKKLIINKKEAETVNYIFESYLEVSSLSELSKKLEDKGIKNKEWTTEKGDKRGGKKFSSSMLQRLFHEKIYLGYIENKITKQAFKGQHKAIISNELWDKVHNKLKDNNQRGDADYRKSTNLLSGKIFDEKDNPFINQVTSKRGVVKNRYYAIKGCYLPVEQVDKITKETLKEILDMPVSDSLLMLKQINFAKLGYIKQCEFIKAFVKKIIYAENKMTFFLNLGEQSLAPFIDAEFINQNNKECYCIIDNLNNQIIVEQEIYFIKGRSSNKYNAGKVGLLTINDNNHLIVRAFAYAWKYKRMYEEGMGTDEIAKTEKTSLRTIYKFLSIAYLSPKVVNALLLGKINIPVRELYDLASKFDTFPEQENLFFNI